MVHMQHERPHAGAIIGWLHQLPRCLDHAWDGVVCRSPSLLREAMEHMPLVARVGPDEAAFATFLLRFADHGSPRWRLFACIASGEVTREDVEILAEVIEAQRENEP